MDPVLVWSRAFALAAVTMLAGIVGHLSADGLLPGVPVLTGLFVVALVLCAALLNRPASRRRIVALLVLGQTAVHVVFSATAGHVGERVASTPHVSAGGLPSVGGRRVGSLMDSYDATIGATSGVAPALPIGHLVDDLSAHAPMMAAHLAAAALVGLWLAAGERALWSLVALASRAALGPLAVAFAACRVVVAPPSPVVPIATEPRPPQAPALLARVVVRRGPPALLAA
ncbi:hypothetical protein [Nocardioides sp. InS609-2]|uniref:hypothetical protein n=1 Tax=Nocardioides sp. InS609-2 TaxID=2760705 RepID=UPI0020BDBE4B|nr:hypothetical protein [Nocardioides sp. InS609-2]